jgi:hypothetical protein
LKILSLSKMGEAVASTPATELTPGWRIIYFLRRRGGSATEEQVKNIIGSEYSLAISKLTHGEKPLVNIING